jgi:hypothetical protein
MLSICSHLISNNTGFNIPDTFRCGRGLIPHILWLVVGNYVYHVPTSLVFGITVGFWVVWVWALPSPIALKYVYPSTTDSTILQIISYFLLFFWTLDLGPEIFWHFRIHLCFLTYLVLASSLSLFGKCTTIFCRH